MPIPAVAAAAAAADADVTRDEAADAKDDAFDIRRSSSRTKNSFHEILYSRKSKSTDKFLK